MIEQSPLYVTCPQPITKTKEEKLNQKQAKRLRSIAYDGADKSKPTKYRKMIRKVNGKYVDTGAIRCKGEREIYLNMKKRFNQEEN